MKTNTHKPVGQSLDDSKQRLGHTITASQAALNLPVSEHIESSLSSGRPLLHKVYKHHSFKILAIALCSAVVLIVIWLGADYRYAAFKLNGVNFRTSLSNLRLDQALSSAANDYRLKIIYPDKSSRTYSLKQIGLSFNATKTVLNARAAQHKLGQRFTFWRPINISLSFNKNNQIFSSFIAKSTQIVITPPTNATLSIVGANIDIANQTYGKEYKLSSSTASLYKIAANLSKTPIRLSQDNIDPSVTAATLQPYKSQLDSIINQSVSISVNSQVFHPSPIVVAGWITLNPSDGQYSLGASPTKVASYIDAITATYNHPPVAQVILSSDSSSVLVPGQSGSQINGLSTAANAIASTLLQAKGINQALKADIEPYETISAEDYPKWIEVDLTYKRLYAYQNSTLEVTDLVTAGAPATPTVTGQYAIYSKYTTQNMSGENVDGSSYYQPNVPWINYFYKGYAIHGNYWRPTSYFGNVNSSHGCVGLMVNDALWIYNWAPIGTPVIIHY